jgi:hypothetical protein
MSDSPSQLPSSNEGAYGGRILLSQSTWLGLVNTTNETSQIGLFLLHQEPNKKLYVRDDSSNDLRKD